MNPLFLESAACQPHWQKVGRGHHHGLLIPLFSLQSKTSCGIGEYLDLLPLIGWSQQLGCDLLQLLPLNDTGGGASPYSAISAFALNPLHLTLGALPEVESDRLLQEELRQLQLFYKGAKRERVHYEWVSRSKRLFLGQYLQRHGHSLSKSSGYGQFCKNNQFWLPSYCLYKTLKACYEERSWEQWPQEVRSLSSERLEGLLAEHTESCEKQALIQYLCFIQLHEVALEAQKQKVLLKGDLPILVARDSADVWHWPHLFELGYNVGAPPDYYSSTGQDWGVPLYSWEGHRNEHYLWWKERLRYASSFYELYRIDHAVGLFRLWAIPKGAPGHEGAFSPPEWNRWIPEGEERLRQLLGATSMLPIGEDLGSVPPQVRNCMARLGVCGTKVLRWERDWQGDGHFLKSDTFSPFSLCTLSTHDTDSLRGWWSHAREEAEQLCNERGWHYEQPISYSYHRALLEESHQGSSLFHVNLLQDYLGLFPELVVADPEGERVNQPGTVSDKNWSCRFLPLVEELTAHRPLAQLLEELTSSRRFC